MSYEKYKEARERAKNKYYNKSKFRSRHHKYTRQEEKIILDQQIPDSEIADLLNVSVKSIHNKRSRLYQEVLYGTQIW